MTTMVGCTVLWHHAASYYQTLAFSIEMVIHSVFLFLFFEGIGGDAHPLVIYLFIASVIYLFIAQKLF